MFSADKKVIVGWSGLQPWLGSYTEWSALWRSNYLTITRHTERQIDRHRHRLADQTTSETRAGRLYECVDSTAFQPCHDSCDIVIVTPTT